MAPPSSSKVSLKLLIDVKSQKVLFAEAGKDFVDFLFHILSLPIGTVVKLLNKNSMVGCLGNLYGSIENLSDTFIQPNKTKESVLNPAVATSDAETPVLLLPCSSETRKFYQCSSFCAQWGHYVADDPKAVCPNCKNLMSKEMKFVAPAAVANKASSSSSAEGGFVKGVVTYMILDDLVIKPMSTISSITLLNKFNVQDVRTLEEKVVDVGMAEGLKVLKASLQCQNVLTRVFLS